jgi:hypothetical protein
MTVITYPPYLPSVFLHKGSVAAAERKGVREWCENSLVGRIARMGAAEGKHRDGLIWIGMGVREDGREGRTAGP